MIKYRIDRLCELLDNNQAMLVTSDANRFYLTGFNSDCGSALIFGGCAYLLVDFRYYERARNEAMCEVIESHGDKELIELLKKNDINEIFVETEQMTIAERKRLCRALGGVEISNDRKCEDVILQMRQIKTEQEFEFIRKAQKMTDDTFDYILPRISAGRTERKVMLDMEFYMRSLGSEGVSFDFIVVSGKNSSLPHGVPTDKVIEKGDFVTMDFGAVVNGYHSDMTRTVVIGSVSDEQRLVYDTVLKAQNASFAVMKSGVRGCDVDKAARDVINSAGFEGCFGHALRHSVGLEIHESPVCSPNFKKPLKSGTVMTVEPGIYIDGRFGVRIEDMVFVTDNGFENITKSDKSLIIL